METDATRMCALLVGLPDVNVLAVADDDPGRPLRVHVETTAVVAGCGECGTRAWLKDQRPVALVDLASFGRPVILVWHKRRWCCPDVDCATRTFTERDARIATPKARVTDRAGRWLTLQVGRLGRTVAEVARELGCDWHTVMDAVTAYGEALLKADTARTGGVEALGLDETLFVRRGPRHHKEWATSVVDVGGTDRAAKLLEVIEGRTAKVVSKWIDAQPAEWRNTIKWGTLDMSGPYRKVFNDSLGHVTQVADPFHVIKHANSKVDECRRRVQNETLGHRGRKTDPLYRCRRLLTKAHERLDDNGESKLLGLLAAGDPKGDVRMAWHAKETVRALYDISDPDLAAEFIDELIENMADESMPEEVRALAGTLRRWRAQIIAWHTAHVTNGPTEEMNNLIKRTKRVGFGFRRFSHYRIRVLLYAGKPNWDLLAGVTPP